MTDLEDLPQYLQTLTDEDWQRLFAFIPLIENSTNLGTVKGIKKQENGTISMPYMALDDRVVDFVQTVYDLGLVPTFDWKNWEEGRALLNQKEADFTQLETVTLCKLLTVIIRADRFNEGYLVKCLKQGQVLGILKGLKTAGK